MHLQVLFNIHSKQLRVWTLESLFNLVINQINDPIDGAKPY